MQFAFCSLLDATGCGCWGARLQRQTAGSAIRVALSRLFRQVDPHKGFTCSESLPFPLGFKQTLYLPEYPVQIPPCFPKVLMFTPG